MPAPTLPADLVLHSRDHVESNHVSSADAVACGNCIVWGDPHIMSFATHRKRLAQHPDKEALLRTRSWKLDQLTTNEVGTYWLVQSEQVLIQARYWKNWTNTNTTVLGAVVVGGPFLSGNVLIFRPLSSDVTWNDESIVGQLGSTFHNEWISARYHAHAEMVKDGKQGPGIEATLPLGVSLAVNRWKHNLAIKIHMCALPSGQSGQCGVLEDKRPTASSEPPVDLLSDGLRVRAEEMLFPASKFAQVSTHAGV